MSIGGPEPLLVQVHLLPPFIHQAPRWWFSLGKGDGRERKDWFCDQQRGRGTAQRRLRLEWLFGTLALIFSSNGKRRQNMQVTFSAVIVKQSIRRAKPPLLGIMEM